MYRGRSRITGGSLLATDRGGRTNCECIPQEVKEAPLFIFSYF